MRYQERILFKGKKLIESCCIVFQLKVYQKEELQAEKSWPRVLPSTVQKMQDEGLRLKNKHVQTVEIFIEPNSVDFVHASRR